MTSRNWFHLWMRLADALSLRVCNFMEGYADHCDSSGLPYQDADWYARNAVRWARMRRRAIRRADEALARVSLLRVDGGAA